MYLRIIKDILHISLGRPAKTPDLSPGRPNKHEGLQSDAAVGAAPGTSLHCSVPVPKKIPVKITRPEQVNFDMNCVEVRP